MNYNLLRFTLFLFVFASSNAFSQCPLAPNFSSVVQPTCTNLFGTANLTGLPSGSWEIYAVPLSGPAPIIPTLTGSGTTAAVPGLSPSNSYTFYYIEPSVPCTSLVSFSININTLPNPPATLLTGTAVQPNCAPGVTTGSVPITNLPASGGWVITATPASGPSLTQSGIGPNYTFTNLPIGIYTFTVTLNSSGCTSAPSNVVNIVAPVNPSTPIVVSGSIVQPTCTTNSGSVQFSGMPSGIWTLNASPGTLTITGSTSIATFSGLTPGVSYLFTVTNDQSCTSNFTSSITIFNALSVPPIPIASAIQPNCPTPSGTITVSAPLGAYTYSIDGVSYQTSPLFSGVPPGNYTVYVQDNASGCISSNAPTVINPLPTPPNITLLYVDSISCNGLSDGGAAVQVTSGGTPPFVYSWSPMGGTNDTVTNLPLGNYNIVVVDAAQCVVVQSFIIAQPSALTIFGSSTPIDCELGTLGTVDVDVSGGVQPYLYTWNIPSVSTDSISNLDIGSYSVNVTDNNGCSIAYGTTIGIINGLLVNINPADTSINPGTSFVANAYSLGSDYVWTPIDGLSCTTCPNPVVSPDSSGIYYVSVSDDNGCQGSDSMSVTVKLLCGELYVPTIFSPNGIGPEANNKLWVFGKVACIKRFSFQIYDRWGELVFESINLLDGWDGNFKERPATVGNYVYKLSVLLYDDSIYNASGSLTLVR